MLNRLTEVVVLNLGVVEHLLQVVDRTVGEAGTLELVAPELASMFS